jgi:hypothetical protein
MVGTWGSLSDETSLEAATVDCEEGCKTDGPIGLPEVQGNNLSELASTRWPSKEKQYSCKTNENTSS